MVLIARGLVCLARHMSLNRLRGVGRGGATVFRFTARRERRRTLEHLGAAFPDTPDSWRRRVERDLALHMGCLLGEAAWLWSASADDITRMTRLHGVENLRSALAENRGVILVTGHCGNWEWMNLALGIAGYPLTVAAREVFEPRLDTMVRTLRGRFGGETVVRGERAGQRLVRAIRRGAVVGLLIDQDINAPGAFVEFFGRPAWSPTGAAQLALRLHAPVVTGFCYRHSSGQMEIRISPAWPGAAGDTPEIAAAQMTANLTAAIEAQIRAAPAQWPWFHRRWRRQPEEGQRTWRPDQATQRWIQQSLSGAVHPV